MKGWLKALLFFFAWLLAEVIITLPLLLATGMDGENLQNATGSTRTNILFLTTALQFIATLLVVYIFVRFVEKKPLSVLGFSLKGKTSHLMLGMLLGFLLISVGILALMAAGMITLTLENSNIVAVATSLALFAVVAVNEEVVVRGYLLRVLMESSGKYWALAISSLVFALLHVMNPNVSWIAMLNVFLAGLLLGVYYIHYKNLWFPIGLHFTWNFSQGPIWGSNVSGTNSQAIFSQQLSGNELLTGGAFGFEASLVCSLLLIVAIVGVELWAKRADSVPVQPEL